GSYDVDCVSSSKCISGGEERPTEASQMIPLVTDWDGTVWLRDGVPSFPSSSATLGVSCSKAVDCIAVGETIASGRSAELVMKSTEVANQEVPDTSIISGPSGTVTSVNQTFNFGSSEAGGGYE